MAGEWRVLPFSHAVLLNPGVHLERGTAYPFVDMAAVNSSTRSVQAISHREYSGGGSRFRSGDTLMARITPCLENGKIARFDPLTSESMTAAHGSTEFIVLRGRPNVTDTDFVYYLTKWPEVRNYAIGQMTGTSGRQRVPTDCFDHLTIAIPPLPKQHAIAHILGTLDDKIELNRRMNETLEAMARALFKDWFVDFGPTRAKMEGRDPYLAPELWDLFPDKLDEDGKPEGWETKALSEVIELNPERSLRKGAVAPYLAMANMPTKGHRPSAVVDRFFGSGMRFSHGDTLVARITPCLENGKTAYVDFLQDGEIGWGSTEYIVMRPEPPFPNEFAYCLARSTSFREFAIQNMTGTSGRQRVPVTVISNFHLPLPIGPDIPEVFGKFIKPTFSLISYGARESDTLTALRDALLPGLMSGEIRVSDADKIVQEST